MSDFQANITEHAPLVGDANNAIKSITSGSSGDILTSNGASSDPSWQSPNLGMTLFASATPVAQSSVEFTDLEEGRYVLFIDKLTLSISGAHMQLTVSNDNGTSYESTGYASDAFYIENGTTTLRTTTNSTSYIWASHSLSNLTSRTYNANLNLVNVNSSSYFQMYGDSTDYTAAFSGYARSIMSGVQNTVTGIDAIEITPSSGNVTGNFYLFKVDYS